MKNYVTSVITSALFCILCVYIGGKKFYSASSPGIHLKSNSIPFCYIIILCKILVNVNRNLFAPQDWDLMQKLVLSDLVTFCNFYLNTFC